MKHITEYFNIYNLISFKHHLNTLQAKEKIKESNTMIVNKSVLQRLLEDIKKYKSLLIKYDMLSNSFIEEIKKNNILEIELEESNFKLNKSIKENIELKRLVDKYSEDVRIRY